MGRDFEEHVSVKVTPNHSIKRTCLRHAAMSNVERLSLYERNYS